MFLGFFTTFTMLARDHLSLKQVSWVLIKVFFGSSYLGFDVMNDISPIFGPPLMLVFVTLTNILLITSLISILSNSFSKVTAHAREEYLYVYSVYVLEASTSNRLTHFYPPLNLIPLILIRPLRLFVSSESLRSIRILLLKATHSPFIAMIWVYEALEERIYGNDHTFAPMGPQVTNTKKVFSRPFLVGWTSAQSIIDTRDFANNKKKRPDSSNSYADIVKGRKEGPSKGRKGEQGEDLHKKVDDLNAKIAELTALIMASQQKSTLEI